MEKTRGIHCIDTILVVAALTQSIFTSSDLYSLYFHEEFMLKDVILFVNSNRSCGFVLHDLPSLILQDNSIDSKETCVLFAIFEHMSFNETVLINHVTFITEGVKYNVDVKRNACYGNYVLERVKLFLSCHLKTASNGKTCVDGRDCNSENELCNRLFEDENKTGLCMARHDLFGSCDTDMQCKPTTKCKHIGGRGVCYCPEGSEIINGTCLKVGMSLNESCSNDRQCTGTANAGRCQQNKQSPGGVCSCDPGFLQEDWNCLRGNQRLFQSCESHRQCTGTYGARECKVIAGIQMCHCPDNHIVVRDFCLKVGLTIGELCITDRDCTSTQNGGRCVYNNATRTQTCNCNEGYLRNGSFCLAVNKTLFETCEIDKQCNGTLGLEICRTIGDRKICACGPEYIEDKTSLTCQKVGKRIFESCMVDDQCTGTIDADVCGYQESTSIRICVCSDGYEWVNESCVPTGRELLESCVFDVQCNGTNGATICKSFGNRSLCFCDEGMLEFDGRCIGAGRSLGDPCEMDRQCIGTLHAGVCGEKSWCSCDQGFIEDHSECVKDGRAWEIMYQCLLVGAGGGFFGISYVIVMLLGRLRRYLLSKAGRQTIQTVQNATEAVYGEQSCDPTVSSDEPSMSNQQDECGKTQHIYHQLNSTVEDEENEYSHQMASFREQNPSYNVYNDTFRKNTPRCQNMYDVVQTISDHVVHSSNEAPNSIGLYEFAEPLDTNVS
ncbi:rh5-interacting protein-like [Ostrea edulis]|uniref:rh5-interacting protein-like n=1 Tax=Ostrea edulis TaxID=37623 RepID=UPI0024AF936F|nr:rh5-interacting protein-like [Ostrea edulis]